MTLDRFKFLVFGTTSIPVSEQRLVFNAKELSTGTLGAHSLMEGSTVDVLVKVHGGSSKRISEKDVKGTELKLTKAMCLLSYDSDRTTWRVMMPCGHPFTPDALTDYLSKYFERGFKTVIRCPTSTDLAPSKCLPWSFQLVIRAAMLTDNERHFYEAKGGSNWILSTPGVLFLECPQCKSYCYNDRALERVACVVCQRAGKTSDFCSRCYRNWEDLKGRCKTCALDPGPINRLLANAPTTNIGEKSGYHELKNIPSWRSCPRFEDHPYPVLIEHVANCKHVRCPNCKKEFCFCCLSKKPDTLGYGWTCGQPYDMCPGGKAPPQVIKSAIS